MLASGEADPAYVTANGGTVYWTDLVSGAILKVTVTDGIPSSPEVLASDQNGPAYLAVDNGTVYWIDGRRPRSWRYLRPAAPRPSVVAGTSTARLTWRWAHSDQRPVNPAGTAGLAVVPARASPGADVGWLTGVSRDRSG